jgi:hypothetical protein
MLAAVSLILTLAPALACSPVPPLAIPLDRVLERATLPAAALARVTDLRAQITALAGAGKLEQAREIEEQAMRILGYRKAWLKCGEGTFAWIKLG